MENQLLFVYGTLRRGSGSGMWYWLAEHADFAGIAAFRGKLYRIGDYPGAVATTHAADMIVGELYRLRDADSVLARLDEYEECGPGFPEPAEYVRSIRTMRLQNGEALAAWVYLYNRPVEGLESIATGDFLKPAAGEPYSFD